jgi:hypothetical protein
VQFDSMYFGYGDVYGRAAQWFEGRFASLQFVPAR